MTAAHARRIGATFAAVVVGVDLRSHLDEQTAESLREMLATHGVLIFRDQRIEDADQIRLISAFGVPHRSSFEVTTGANPFLIDITNVDAEGLPLPRDNRYALYMKANEQWHSDGTYNRLPHAVTSLHARALPPEPPPTQYADTQAAWEALPARRQIELEGLVIEHDRAWSLSKVSPEAAAAHSDVNGRMARQPLVRTHPVTGRKSLYLSSHASHVVGRPKDQGISLIGELIAHATQPHFVYTHQWQVYDLVIWDAALTLHRATPYSAANARRMRQGAALLPRPLIDD
jgi:alpha-ketoglutarate-dependent 2,4-dichlorophenoxyacetate dioxygenase